LDAVRFFNDELLCLLFDGRSILFVVESVIGVEEPLVDEHSELLLEWQRFDVPHKDEEI
jgi:hypothetical protein